MLMQGDLVYNHRNWVCPVVGIEDGFVKVIAGHYGETTYDIDSISPIPISLDIMKQLGWEEIETTPSGSKKYKHPWYTDTLSFYLSDQQNDLFLWMLNGDFPIRYVQDLQHLLRHVVAADIAYDNEKQEFYLFDVTFKDRYIPETK